MISPVLSVLLMGMLPVLGIRGGEEMALQRLPIASPSPLLAEKTEPSFEIDGHISSSGVLVTDLDSGQVLYGLDQERKRPMASLTKLMTAVLIVESHDPLEWVTIPSDMNTANGTTAYLPHGQQFRVGDLLSALLIASANDAAEALAVYHSGSMEKFSEEMNARAKTMGLKNTSFANPVGLDDTDQWSTPRDIAWLASFAMRQPEIGKRLSMRGTRIVSRAGQQVALTHTHAFLHADTGVIAGKTGTTLGAGQCLFSVVKEGDRRYLVVLLNSLQRYKDMRIILDALAHTSVI